MALCKNGRGKKECGQRNGRKKGNRKFTMSPASVSKWAVGRGRGKGGGDGVALVLLWQ